MRIVVDRDVCIGAGQCVLAAPEVFDQDSGDGRVILITPDPENTDREKLLSAIHICPSGALTAAD